MFGSRFVKVQIGGEGEIRNQSRYDFVVVVPCPLWAVRARNDLSSTQLAGTADAYFSGWRLQPSNALVKH